MESSKHIEVLKQEKDELHLSLKGEFILTQIKGVYEEFQKLSKVSENKIFITLKEMKSLDLTGIQLIIGLKKILELNNKQVSLELIYPKDVETLLTISGFSTL